MPKKKSHKNHHQSSETNTPSLPRSKLPERRPQIRIPKRKTPRVIQLLNNPEALGKIEDLAATGASLATIDAAMMFPSNTLSKILTKGRDKRNKSYIKFYMLFRSWAAEARHAAESSMVKRSPDKWLDRNSSAKTIESEQDRELAISSNQPQHSSTGAEAAKVLEALKILRTQNISIDEAIDKNSVSLNIEDDTDDSDA